MRVGGRAAVAGVAGLIAGLLVSLVAAAWLRSTTPEAGLLWGVAPTGKIAIWTLAGAHGVPLRVQAGAEVSDELGEIGSRIGELFGGDTGSTTLPAPRGDLQVRLASLTVLASLGLVIALAMSRSGVRDLREAAAGAVVAGAVNGAGLAVLVAAGAARLGFDARIVRVGVEASMPVGVALVLGALWGAAFALIGALAAPRVAGALSPLWRVSGAAAKRAALVASAVAIVVLIVMAIEQAGGGTGIGLGADLGALGAFLLGANVVGAAIVLSHGPSMQVALDAGPLSGFTRVGYVPQGSSSLPTTRWLFVLVPIAAGVAAGRMIKRRLGDRSDVSAAAAFGVVWGVALGVLAFLLRVRVLSSFSVGSLAAGGGASINPVVALVFGTVLGSVTSYVGMVTAKATTHPLTPPLETIASVTPAAPAEPRACPSCGKAVPENDRFCGSCGQAL